MLLDYARTRSDATVAKQGDSEELEAHKRRRLAEKGAHPDNRDDFIWKVGTQAGLSC